MEYSKPEVEQLGSALTAIQGVNKHCDIVLEGGGTYITKSAYEADE